MAGGKSGGITMEEPSLVQFIGTDVFNFSLKRLDMFLYHKVFLIILINRNKYLNGRNSPIYIIRLSCNIASYKIILKSENIPWASLGFLALNR